MNVPWWAGVVAIVIGVSLGFVGSMLTAWLNRRRRTR
jgi:hypothetical protein